MSVLNKIWSWLTKAAPEEAEEILRAEEVLLEVRLTKIKEELVKANNRKAFVVAERLVKELRQKRGTPLTDAEQHFLKSFTPREDCQHTKGAEMRQLGEKGRWFLDKFAGSKGRHKDYNVRDHIFPDRSRVIKCLTCGKKWTKDSPDWKEAMRMSSQSTNTPSSSEYLVPLP